MASRLGELAVNVDCDTLYDCVLKIQFVGAKDTTLDSFRPLGGVPQIAVISLKRPRQTSVLQR